VQSCSVPDPNPNRAIFDTSERAAALAEQVPFVNAQKWLCTRICSPVIGQMIAYCDAFHISNSYATYLARVLQTSLKKVLA